MQGKQVWFGGLWWYRSPSRAVTIWPCAGESQYHLALRLARPTWFTRSLWIPTRSVSKTLRLPPNWPTTRRPAIRRQL